MRLPIAVLVVALVPLAPQAMAQGRESVLEEVIVTAQHREESAMSTPISLFTLNAEQLEKQRIGSISNLNGLIPNLNIDNFPANNQTLRLFIRGVGLSDTQITQDPAVGVYLNGAYIARSAGLTFDVADLERIEVLRGPQGTLYGRNTTGGAIKLITRKPDLNDLAFDQTLSTGNRDLFSSKTSINLPFADKYAAKLAYFYEDVDGFTENTGPGGSFGDRESNGFRLDLRAELSDALTLDYGYDNSKIKYFNYTAQAVIPRPSGSGDLLSVVGDIVEANGYVKYDGSRFSKMATSVPLLPTNTDIDGHTLNAVWTINDNMALHSITAWRELRDKSYIDFASGATEEFRIDFNTAVIGANAGDQRIDLAAVRPYLQQEQFSQEFQLLGNLNESIEYLAGLYYFWEKADEDQPPHHIFDVYPFAGGTLINYGAERNKIENDAVAAFSQFTWTPDILEQRLHLTLGGRLSWDTRQAERQVTDTVVIDQDTSVQSLVPTTYFSAKPDHDFDDTSYTFITEYELQESLNVYGKYAGAYKSGGYNIRDPEEQGFGNGFKEEKLNAWELGLKGEGLDRRVRLSADVFYQKFEDYQFNFQIPGTISGTRVFNIDNGEMSGVEVELMATPVTGLLLQASYAFLDSQLDPVDNPFSGETEEFSFGNAPRHSYSFVAGYTFPATSIGVVNANASYNYVGDRDPHSVTGYRDAYDLINARVALTEIPGLGGQWEVAAWGKNLADNNYEAFVLDNLPQANRAVIWETGAASGSMSPIGIFKYSDSQDRYREKLLMAVKEFFIRGVRKIYPLAFLDPEGDKGIEKRGHRDYIGGHWEQIGKLQFDFLVAKGLQPESYLLDIACGSLRLGVKAIPYLQPEHYLGIEKESGLVAAGFENELDKAIRAAKRPRIVISDTFQFSKIGQQADFAIAQSLFSHLPPNLIALCFKNLRPWLADDGVFFATYFEVETPRKNASKPHDHGYFAYTKSEMAAFGTANGFSATYIGDWKHPANQVIVEYRKT